MIVSCISWYHMSMETFPSSAFVQLNNATLIRGDSYTTITIPGVGPEILVLVAYCNSSNRPPWSLSQSVRNTFFNITIFLQSETVCNFKSI